MSGEDTRSPSYDDLRELVGRLERENQQLRGEIEKLKKIVESLEQAAKRQAAPFSKGKRKPDPQKCGRKPGDEYGKKGFRRAPKKVDEIHRAPLPSACPECAGDVEFLKLEHQFQVEVPCKPVHRRFDIEVGRCACCGRRVQGRHPLQTSDALGAAASQIGPEAQALAVHLNKDLGLSHRSEEHTSELQSQSNLVCRLLLE